MTNKQGYSCNSEATCIQLQNVMKISLDYEDQYYMKAGRRERCSGGQLAHTRKCGLHGVQRVGGGCTDGQVSGRSAHHIRQPELHFFHGNAIESARTTR